MIDVILLRLLCAYRRSINIRFCFFLLGMLGAMIKGILKEKRSACLLICSLPEFARLDAEVVFPSVREQLSLFA